MALLYKKLCIVYITVVQSGPLGVRNVMIFTVSNIYMYNFLSVQKSSFAKGIRKKNHTRGRKRKGLGNPGSHNIASFYSLHSGDISDPKIVTVLCQFEERKPADRFLSKSVENRTEPLSSQNDTFALPQRSSL